MVSIVSRNRFLKLRGKSKRGIKGSLRRAMLLPGADKVRGELRFFNALVLSLLAYSLLGLLSMVRLAGVPGIPQIQLASYRLLDLALILFFVATCRGVARLRVDDMFLFLFAAYPAIIGLFFADSWLTYTNDLLIFFGFAVKIILVRSVLERMEDIVGMTPVLRIYRNKFILFAAFLAIIAIVTGAWLLYSGLLKYYQTPAEVTFAAALALANRNTIVFAFFMAFAALSGKRMIAAGILAMAFFSVFISKRTRGSLIRLIALLLLVSSVPLIYVFGQGIEFDFSSSAAMNKMKSTYELLLRASNSQGGLQGVLRTLDPARYAEYVSLQPHLSDWRLIVGNGFGFRYDLLFWVPVDPTSELEGNITNAHFTPLGIVAKFGVLGLALWCVLLGKTLFFKIDSDSVLQTAARLSFFSMIIQSLFAFNFFSNPFVPFYIAILTVRRSYTMVRPKKLKTT